MSLQSDKIKIVFTAKWTNEHNFSFLGSAGWGGGGSIVNSFFQFRYAVFGACNSFRERGFF
jgi:hypothetical protein